MAINVSLSLGTVLKFLFILLTCITTVVMAYTTITDGFPYRKEIRTPWMTATLIDIYIHAVAIGAWISYKQSGWISTIIWIVLLVGLRSIVTCLYVSIQFLKLSSRESTEDPIYHVLQRSKKKSGECGFNIFTVAIGRVIFGALGCLMLGILIYDFTTAGWPFNRDELFKLRIVFVDFYTNLVPILVWIAYKELSFVRSAIWMILIMFVGSAATGPYIVYRLWELDSSDPMYLVLFNSDDRMKIGYESANYEKEDSSSVEQTP